MMQLYIYLNYDPSGDVTDGICRRYDAHSAADRCGYCTSASPRGNAVIGAVPYRPQEWIDDGARREQADIDEMVTFRTKPQPAIDLLTEVHARGLLLQDRGPRRRPSHHLPSDAQGETTRRTTCTAGSVTTIVTTSANLAPRANRCVFASNRIRGGSSFQTKKQR